MIKGIVSSSVSKYLPATAAYNNAVIAAGGSLSSAQLHYINIFIKGLQDNGLWADLLFFYPFLSKTSLTLAAEITHSINMRNPGVYTLAYLPSSKPANHASTYYTIGGGSTVYQIGNTGLIPSGNWSPNDVSWGAYVKAGGSTGSVFGVRNSASSTSTTPTFTLNNYSTLGSPFASAYSYTGNGSVAGATLAAFYGYSYVVRRSVSDLSIYKNAVLNAIKTATTAQGSQPLYPIYVGGYNNGNVSVTQPTSTKNICDVWVAKRGFTGGELSIFYALELSMNNNLGR